MITSSSGYDLFEPLRGHTTETLLVITPYVEKSFFDQLINTAKPRKLFVVVDDGCRRDDLQTIWDAVKGARLRNRPKKPVTVLGSARGLVHLKLFYSVMKSPAGRRKRRIVFGSANATEQGFGGRINAEILCHTTLFRNRHQKVIDWCDDVISKAKEADGTEPCDRVEEVTATLADGIQLRLPAFTIGRKRKHLSSFDLWVQRGRLLASFRPDPTFLKVPVPLKKGLGTSALSENVSEIGFARPETKNLNFPYIGPIDDEAGEDNDRGAHGKWRSQYFTWTNLGDWCSEECFRYKKKTFIRKGSDLRRQRLNAMEKLRDKKVKAQVRKNFLDKLDRLWTLFGEDAASYLEGTHELDYDHYIKKFDDRVDRDLDLIRNEDFRSRYLTGYEITELPRFQSDVRGWNGFVESLAKELCYQGRKQKPMSKLLKAIQDAAPDHQVSLLQNSSTLVEFLRNNWPDQLPTGALEDFDLGTVARYHNI